MEDLRLSLISPEVRSLAPGDAGILLLRLDALEAKLRSTLGRVEALEFNFEILSRDANHRISEFSSKLAELDRKNESSSLQADLLKEELQPETKNSVELSNETLAFDRALLSFNSRDFESALSRFDSFNQFYPQSINVAESYYWLGKANVELLEFKDAATNFLESFSRDPVGIFAWKSLLGLANSLGELGQMEQGCLTLVELKSRFPGKARENWDQILIVEDQLKCSP